MTEDTGVRRAVEDALVDLRDSHRDFASVQSMHTVANTIFPISLYRPGTDGAASRFIANALKAEQNRRHATRRRWGTYLGRLVAYPARDGGATNQLAINLDRLSGRDRQWSDLYEVPITSPDGDHDDPDWETPGPESSATVGAVLHGDSRLDALRRGGPCLAHISLTLEDGVVSMLALYRRHSYVTRAYGNFLGLARLLYFLAHESGHDVGNLLVVTATPRSTHPGARNCSLPPRQRPAHRRRSRLRHARWGQRGPTSTFGQRPSERQHHERRVPAQVHVDRSRRGPPA